MQKIKVSRIEKSQGQGKPAAIFDENNTRFSGFDLKLNEVSPGDIIQADIDIITKGNRQYFNITSFSWVERAGEKETPEVTVDRAEEIARLDRLSRERIAALNAAIGLSKNNDHSYDEEELMNKAFTWAISRFDGIEIPELPENREAEATTHKEAPQPGSPEFANQGEFYDLCHKTYGLTKSAADAALSPNIISPSIDLADPAHRVRAWRIIKEKYGKEKGG